jgi:hypothetical protein
MRNNITLLGQLMYPCEAVPRFIALLRSGLLPLDHVDVTNFRSRASTRPLPMPPRTPAPQTHRVASLNCEPP